MKKIKPIGIFLFFTMMLGNAYTQHNTLKLKRMVKKQVKTALILADSDLKLFGPFEVGGIMSPSITLGGDDGLTLFIGLAKDKTAYRNDQEVILYYSDKGQLLYVFDRSPNGDFNSIKDYLPTPDGEPIYDPD
jgi:hypothetical protein